MCSAALAIEQIAVMLEREMRELTHIKSVQSNTGVSNAYERGTVKKIRNIRPAPLLELRVYSLSTQNGKKMRRRGPLFTCASAPIHREMYGLYQSPLRVRFSRTDELDSHRSQYELRSLVLFLG